MSVRSQIADLERRVTALEGRVQAHDAIISKRRKKKRKTKKTKKAEE